MVGHQYFYACFLRCFYPIYAAYAIIDGDNNIGLLLFDQLDNFRGQTVAVFKAVGDDEAHSPCPQQLQTFNRNGATGRAVSIKIGDNQ